MSERAPQGAVVEDVGEGAPQPRRAWRIVVVASRVVGAALLVAYPMLVYAGLSSWSPRYAALGLMILFLPAAIARLKRLDRGALRSLAIVPVLVVAALALGAVANEAGAVLAVPVVINAALLVGFGTTLRAGSTPMIERFARLQVTELSPPEVRWCRAWTRVWTGFFAINGATAAALALWAPLKWWTLYNGLVAYILMGLLFAAEYVPRKLRFGRLGDGPLDRVLARFQRTGEASR